MLAEGSESRRLQEENFACRYTFCTLVTRPAEYGEMLESARQAGFCGDDVEYLYFDNTSANGIDAYAAINRAIRSARGEILVFCHQDILFEFDNKEVLEARIAQIEALDARWAVLGNAGKTPAGRAVVRITDPKAANLSQGPFPARVLSLDENLLILNRRQNLFCSPQLRGFHLYGTDLCQNADHLGLKCYVIDFHLRHKSAGNVDASYRQLQQDYMALQSQRRKGRFIRAMCSQFFVSSSVLLMRLFNQKWLLNLHKSLSKKRETTG